MTLAPAHRRRLASLARGAGIAAVGGAAALFLNACYAAPETLAGIDELRDMAGAIRDAAAKGQLAPELAARLVAGFEKVAVGLEAAAQDTAFARGLETVWNAAITLAAGFLGIRYWRGPADKPGKLALRSR